MLYRFGRRVTYWLSLILFRMKFVNLERIPECKGFILASNHRSNFDPIFIAVKAKKAVRYMAKAELFRNPFLGWIVKNLYAFPVERGKGDSGAIQQAGDIIRDGGVLGMFPEGTRSKDGKPLRPRSGVAVIAGQTQADVLPVAVCYGEKLRFRTPVTVRYGNVIPFEELGVDPSSPSTIKAASKRIMDDIVALLGEGV